MEDAAQDQLEVKGDLTPEVEPQTRAGEKPSLPRRKPNKDAGFRLSVKAFTAQDTAAEAVVLAALHRAGFAGLADLQRYLGGATVRHALVWLALRTQAFTVID